VRAVSIPKPQGGQRCLGIPNVQDRVIQQALAQVLSPIFEAGFSASSYGYRPGRCAHDAMEAARGYVLEGKTWVVDVDISAFFDAVDHDILMAKIGRKVRDKRVLRLSATTCERRCNATVSSKSAVGARRNRGL
jgi:RNA-directed DNA polymerase